MRRWIRKFLVVLSSSSRFQRLLERNVAYSQYLMGIDSGSNPIASGERVVVGQLELQYRRVNCPLCVFDVGANTGQFSSLLLHGLRSRSIPFQVHAFEPSRCAFEILHNAFKDRENFALNNSALGKVSGACELFYGESGSRLASLSKRRLDHFGMFFKQSETVAIETLDDYCARRGVTSIDLLKLDVEGHELDVLLGGLRMFRERRIRMVSFEFGGCNIDSRTYFQDFWYFFQENGMRCINRIVPSGHLVPILQYREMCEQFRTTNFLVFQTEKPMCGG